MDIPQGGDEEGDEPMQQVVGDPIDDQLIFSEAQLAESLGDPQIEDDDHGVVVHEMSAEEMEVDGIIVTPNLEDEDIHDESLLDTTDEGEEGHILETIVEEPSAEEQALVEQALVEQGLVEQQELVEQELALGEEEQLLAPPPPEEIVEEEELVEEEPPCECPTCIENADENGVFKGLDHTKAKCLICYISILAPEIFHKKLEAAAAHIVSEAEVVGTNVDIGEAETQKIEENTESTTTILNENVAPGEAGSVIGIKSEARDPETDIENVQQLGVLEEESCLADKRGNEEEEEATVISSTLAEETAQRIKDVLTEKMGDGEEEEADAQLNLDLMFQVLSCSFDDLDQDVDLLLNFVPLCTPCHSVVMDAVVIYREIQKLEGTLGNLRETIKDQVSRSFETNFCKRRKETEEIVGLVGQIDATRRAILGEDCPAIAKLLNYKKKGRRGRKPGRKKKTMINKSALYPHVTLEAGGAANKRRGRPPKNRPEYDASGVKLEYEEGAEYDDEDYLNDEDPEEEHEVIQTHSGRKVKKPNYKKWLLGDDDEDDLPGPIVPGVDLVTLVKTEAVDEEPASPKSEPDWSPGHSDEEFKDGAESDSSSEDSDLGSEDDDDDYDDEDDEDDDYSERTPAKRRRESAEGNRIPCTECSRSFADEEKRDRHFQRYHTPGGEMKMRRRRGGGMMRVHSCEHCDKEFKRPNLLKRHLEKDHGIAPENGDSSDKKKHICEFCGQKYRNGSELRVHVRLHTGETPFKCDHCDQSFVSALKRETHIEQCHWEVPPLKCEFCDRAFFRQHRLRIHRITHTGERAYLCEICSQAFSHPTYLKYHQGQHAELNMESYKCKECGKQFANPTNLKLHVKTVHLKEFRFSCEVCGMGFTHMSHKRIHMRGHTGERPYKCEICGESFRYKDRLRIHLRGHTGERPFVCDVCKKGFASRSKLKRHEKIHEKSLGNRSSQEEEPARPLRYSCDDCGKAFAEPQHLSAHKRYCQRKNFGEKEERPKATKSAPGKIKATSIPASVVVAAAVSPTVPVAAATVQKIQIEHIPAHAIQTQQAQMLVPVTYTTYPVAYGYEVSQQYTQQPQQPQHPSNVRDYPNYN